MRTLSKLLITRYEGRVLTARIQNGKVIQMDLEPSEASGRLGNIYIGKVKNIVKNINAAFVDLGGGQMGYYSLSDNESHLFTQPGRTGALREGDEILVPDPVWLNYINVPNLLGARAVTYSLKEENGYQMDFGEIRAKITPRTRAVVIVTPNNPTGGVLEEDVLKELASIVQEHDLMVIADEIYERLVYDGCKHVSIASLPGMKERTFTMNGMSKAYAMDGWRLGYVAAPEEYITAMNKFHQHNTTCAPSFVQAAAIAALTQEGDEVKEMVKEYQRRRDYAVKAINDIDGIHCLCPKGAFYIFINCKELGKSSAELSQYFLEEAKIALVPGDVFGPGGEGYLRMSFAASYESIVEGCGRLKEAVENLKK